MIESGHSLFKKSLPFVCSLNEKESVYKVNLVFNTLILHNFKSRTLSHHSTRSLSCLYLHSCIKSILKKNSKKKKKMVFTGPSKKVSSDSFLHQSRFLFLNLSKNFVEMEGSQHQSQLQVYLYFLSFLGFLSFFTQFISF